MPRTLRLCLVASIALAACGRAAPLSARGPSPADASGSASQDGGPVAHDAQDAALPPTDAGSSYVEVASASPIPDAAVSDAAVGDTSGALDVLSPADGGRVPYRAIAVATGEVHTCAILDDHRLKCWGRNSEGQLGLGDTKDRGGDPSTMGDNLPTVDLGTGRTAIAIAASRDSTCSILDNGSVKCWGEPDLTGQSFFSASGGAPGEMGDNLPALDFGGRKAVNVAMGSEVACASMDDNTIWCWPGGAGPNAAKPSQLTGLPAKRVRALGPSGAEVAAVYDDGTLSADLPDGRVVSLLTSGRNVVAVAGGPGNVTCVLFDDGTTECSDSAKGLTNAIAVGVVESNAIFCAVLTNGDIQCQSAFAEQVCAPPYRCRTDGAFTFVTLGEPAAAITSNGSQFMCALLADGNIKCWGTEPTAAWLGASLDLTTQPDGGIVYGAWHTIDLGTHP